VKRISCLNLLKLGVTACLVLSFIAFNSTRSSAQGFSWPEEPKNLQVLPDEVKGAQLGQIMRGFVSALNVRCPHCHVGEGPDLTKFDFASDEKPAKQKARLMINMVQEINRDHLAQLGEIEDPPQERVKVTCITCHRSQDKPLMLEDILAESIQQDGIEAALDRYRQLREKHYGGFTYDFSSGMLTGLGERLAGEKNYDAALKIVELEIEANGESASTYFTLGGIQASAGMREEAIKTYEKGLELAPEGWKPFFRQRIESLRNP
jgi:tetratricopeptide (TPR) repeat protein